MANFGAFPLTCSKCGRTDKAGDLRIMPSGLCRVCDAVNTARTLYETGRLFAFDCETKGLGMEHEIIRVAVVGQNGLTFHSYVHPRRPIDEASAACMVNGVLNCEVKNAFTFYDAYSVLREILKHENVIAFNVAFDKGHLEADYARVVASNKDHAFANFFPAEWHCVSELFAQFVGTPGRQPSQYKYHSLKTACERLGVVNEHPHEPLSDCYATLGVLKALAAYEVKV